MALRGAGSMLLAWQLHPPARAMQQPLQPMLLQQPQRQQGAAGGAHLSRKPKATKGMALARKTMPSALQLGGCRAGQGRA